ncbi:FAD-dependent oxidoreductase [Caulobacter hibisci]|uniref:FAD-dependent monooxygenase n=1 Tax=Caulobacter hibisci TaxID=2035993 RepID=A0ABS0STK6_9CAUL|nr:FAD-dependent monooxygenase [Caulobacter hibisci]
MERFQVVVAGAGPVGSVAAYRLAQLGIDVLLLESGARCPEDLRASTMHPPTLDMMQELGVLDELEAQGLRAPIYHYRNRVTGEVMAFDMGELGDISAHPYRLQCEQFKLARLMTAKLAEHPRGEVRFSHRLAHFVQDDQGVTVSIEAPFGIEQVRCDYLIGADGANSIVRKWLDIEFEGFTYPEKFLTLSTDWPLEDHFNGLAHVNYVADPKEWCVLLRVPSLWRILVPASGEESDESLLSDAKKNAVLGGLLGDGETVQTVHRTLYKVHQRVAKTYHVGRVLLAGDAAHLNNPLGGFGMNSGIHDVWSLTQKLADILIDKADPEKLLPLYDRQRRAVMHKFIQTQTIANKAAMEAGTAEAYAEREAKMRQILADPDQRREYLLLQSMYKSLELEAATA